MTTTTPPRIRQRHQYSVRINDPATACVLFGTIRCDRRSGLCRAVDYLIFAAVGEVGEVDEGAAWERCMGRMTRLMHLIEHRRLRRMGKMSKVRGEET